MNLLLKLDSKRGSISKFRWKIIRVCDALTDAPKYTEQKREGAVVRLTYSPDRHFPLTLQYDEGPKKGKYIEHSRILGVAYDPEKPTRIEITTRGGTLVELELLPPPGIDDVEDDA